MRFLTLLFITISVVTNTNGQILSAQSGAWNTTTTWVGGVVPTSANDVQIENGHTVTIDAVSPAECNNLLVNAAASQTTLRYAIDGTSGTLTVHGNITINVNGRFIVTTRSPAGAANSYVDHVLNLYGNLTNNGTCDFRGGSNGSGTANGVHVKFVGSSNSTVALNQTNYGSSLEEFNSITINKTGGAEVVLSSGNLYMSNNTSVGTSLLTMTSGLINTGSNRWVYLATNDTGIMNASSTSYVKGTLGRGMSNSAGAERKFYIGDASGFRPVYIRSTISGVASGHHVWAKITSGNANTGSSVLDTGMNKISELRYVEAGYSKAGVAGAAASMTFDRLTIGYLNDDGVSSGNTDLRVAYSTDARANWTSAGPFTHTTDPQASATLLQSVTIGSPFSIADGGSFYCALANAPGGTNPLPVELTSFTAVRRGPSAELRWSTAAEVDNAGFAVERNINNAWTKIGFVEGHGTTNAPQSYTFTDVTATGNVTYRLKQIDRDGGFRYSQQVEVASAVPLSAAVLESYPNPFNPATTVRFMLPVSAPVRLKIFNMLGQSVSTLFEGIALGGHEYQLPFRAEGLSSGMYILRMDHASGAEQKKLILMK